MYCRRVGTAGKTPTPSGIQRLLGLLRRTLSVCTGAGGQIDERVSGVGGTAGTGTVEVKLSAGKVEDNRPTAEI